MTTQRRMRLGLSMRYHGYHVAAWRRPDVPVAGTLDYRYFLRTAQAAERACFDLVFLADSVGVRARDEPEGSQCRSAWIAELEPLTLMSALATHTSHIGLVATASTTYNEPFHVARKYASLDHISGGRAAWNIVTSWTDQEARNFNRDTHLDYETRYERAEEFARVVTGLWDSWEDDAFIRDKASGVFFDPEKLHVLNHRGKHFQVRGPLNSAATPQGRPIIVQAGAADQGQEIAAVYADVVYAMPFDLASAQEYYAGLKSRLVRHGRAPELLRVLPGFTPYVGRTGAEARDKYDQMRAVDPSEGGAGDALRLLRRSVRLRRGRAGARSARRYRDPQYRPRGRAQAQREGLTIRQLYERVAAGNAGRVLIGSAEQIADDMQEWFENGAADGFNICPSHLPGGLDDFAALVVPELQRRGLFRTEYEGTTLRQNLGLPPYLSRYQRLDASRAAE